MGETKVGEAGQFLTFKLADEVFALEISKVREVLEVTSITRVPRTRRFILGVINLRGNVVPVFDLRRKFGLPHGEHTVNTCIIIVEAQSNEHGRLVQGVLVDSVQEVMEIDGGQVEPPPRLGSRLNTSFLKGMGKHQDYFVLILDIDKIFMTDDALTGSFAGDGAGGELAA